MVFLSEQAFACSQLHSSSPKDHLFEHNDNREFYYYKLTDEKNIKIPVILYGDLQNTFPKLDNDRLVDLINEYKSYKGNEKNTKVADIVVAWNVIKYFFPYLKEQSID